MTSYNTIQSDVRQAVCVITLNRPDSLNALNIEVATELQAAIRSALDSHMRAIVLTGAGRAFSAGGDLREMEAIGNRDGRIEAFFDEPLRVLNETVLLIREAPVPLIAAVNGVASGGGCSLALACDLVVAAESARFNQAFIKIGLTPDCGSTFVLPRLIGWKRAAELMFTGDLISAPQAQEMGLINSVVPDAELMDRTLSLAERLAAAPTAAIARIKKLLEASATNDCRSQLELEREAQLESGKTQDFIEGVSAFLEKRPPRFTGS